MASSFCRQAVLGGVVVPGGVPLLRESQAVQRGDEGIKEIGLGSCERVICGGEGE